MFNTESAATAHRDAHSSLLAFPGYTFQVGSIICSAGDAIENVFKYENVLCNTNKTISFTSDSTRMGRVANMSTNILDTINECMRNLSGH